jgi:hypothetical protein
VTTTQKIKKNIRDSVNIPHGCAGGVHTLRTSVTSVTSVTRPVYAGYRGAKKKTSVTNALQQVLQTPRSQQTAHTKKGKNITAAAMI